LTFRSLGEGGGGSDFFPKASTLTERRYKPSKIQNLSNLAPPNLSRQSAAATDFTFFRRRLLFGLAVSLRQSYEKQ
jgi:hypothetical protein